MAYRVQKGGLILSLGFALALGTTLALATHDRGLFQLDRNAKQSILGNGTGDDWDNVLCTNPDDPTTCSTTGPGPGGSFRARSDNDLLDLHLYSRFFFSPSMSVARS